MRFISTPSPAPGATRADQAFREQQLVDDGRYNEALHPTRVPIASEARDSAGANLVGARRSRMI
jgi:hypothetical protein